MERPSLFVLLIVQEKKDQQRREEILSGDLFSLMLKFSIPAILAMSVNAINAFVDAVFVGQFVGENALAAVSIAFSLTMITNAFASLIGIGASSVLSRAIGEKNEAIQLRIFGSVLSLSLVAAMIASVFGFIYANEIVSFIGGKGEIKSLAVIYYRVVILFSFVRIFSVATNMLIRAEGKIKEAMIFTIASTLVNIILDPFFIKMWGISGAAWATVISMTVYTLLNCSYFIRGKASYKTDLKYLGFDMNILKPAFLVGLSAMFLQLMFFVQQVVVFRSVSFYGEDRDMALMGSIYRVLILIVVPVFGFVQALQPIVGINYGAGQLKRLKKAYRLFVICGVSLMTFLALIVQIFPRPILATLVPDMILTEQDIFNYRMVLLPIPVIPLFFLTVTSFQSLGKGRESTLLLLGRELVLFVPIVLILPLYFGINGIYFSWLIMDSIMLIVVLLMAWKVYGNLKVQKL